MARKKVFRSDYRLYPSDECDGICIPLTLNRHAIVDTDDWDKIRDYLWHTYGPRSGSFYVVMSDKHNKRTLLHRKIMVAERGEIVDHINHNPLDNRKSNLRLCSHSQNIHHTRITSRNTSGYKGVDFVKSKYWRARIGIKNKVIELGHYSNPEDAALAYNFAALQYHGEFAVFNTSKQLLGDK